MSSKAALLSGTGPHGCMPFSAPQAATLQEAPGYLVLSVSKSLGLLRKRKPECGHSQALCNSLPPVDLVLAWTSPKGELEMKMSVGFFGREQEGQ